MISKNAYPSKKEINSIRVFFLIYSGNISLGLSADCLEVLCFGVFQWNQCAVQR